MDQELLKSWSKTQEHGEIVYEQFPHLNCSTGNREDVKKYKSFCNFKGNVLDIGSGLIMPSYLTDNDDIILGVGIDPLVKTAYKPDTNLYLTKAIGEYLPFKNEYFDHISFATSFDHVINHQQTLNECLRVLKQDGKIIFWVNSDQEKQSILNKGINKMRLKLSKPQLDQTVSDQEKLVNSMQIPQGAVDKFHLIHITDKGLREMLKDFPLKEISEMKIKGSTFVKYSKQKSI